MADRSFSLLDRLIGEIDKAIKVLAAPARSTRALPVAGGDLTSAGAPTAGEPVLGAAERLESSRLMRVNHSGEVAAQALYQGQALTARDGTVAAALRPDGARGAGH